MDTRKIAIDISSRLRSEQKPKRFIHSVSVAEMTAELCSLNGIDADSGYLAGIAHDMEKHRETQDLQAFLAASGYSRLEELLPHPEALHGAAARIALEETFGVGDPDILEAVETHCYPRLGMRPLSLALWIADKAEPSRTHLDAVLRESLSRIPLEDGFLAVMESMLVHFGRNGWQVYPHTIFLYNTLKGSRQ